MMKITAKVNVYCARGFYCLRNGERKCSRLGCENNRYFCEVFNPFLQTDKNGNVLKCEECLLAEREKRLKE